MSATTTNTTAQPGPSEVTNMLSGMGIHPLHIGSVGGAVNNGISATYTWICSFALTYGVMCLVIAAVVWMFAWKFRVNTLSRWSVRIIVGVFGAECIVILLPQLFVSFIELLDRL
ncbi:MULTISPECIES: hypothetical protein [Alicyclobacillus]|uniref:Uncharacterized protein n=1 Tax=Alicyclobacillus acidoterrestris (strain ATCC 49025 / DSM 3922 / CIP 106132 / NCIMB 13137 / GD3B) TaxID=1356854 RepID=T0BTY4_ALIAG|nr:MULTISPECIES: hypothetical protein [Alicyclobacillus]EPZ44294.1 hypothetical protein N007_11200 [Alicyclobacillus acidoterrestris ATCC 49025]UNO51075.1 hypothetical protein K1I37_21095 [Alicyclobacillus acidoterrestris]GEO27704.1 hypothetical protein AAC03nite_34890 [Alicyclobacillus acidoterrestris]